MQQTLHTHTHITTHTTHAKHSPGLEKLGAPDPVSTGRAFGAGPLQVVRKAEPEHGWRALKTADGHEYYHNSKTGTTTWEKPGNAGTVAI